MTGLYDRNATADLIRSGKPLLLAGDEKLLAGLPKGNWIGGTIPYFMAPDGGLQTAEKIFVTELPSAKSVTIRRYGAAELPKLATDHPGHGFTLLLIPAFSKAHADYAENVAHYPGIFDRPVVGWVSGVALDDIGKVTPKIFDGTTGGSSSEEAVALHLELPADNDVSVDIINLFEPGTGDVISFPATGFSATDAVINGQPANLARYMTERAIDTRLPLVADYNGAIVNVSIQNVDAAAGKVDFYAPVFPGVSYRVAAPIGDYVSEFSTKLPASGTSLNFSCNCILNYVYAGLEGRSTGPLLGPMTFGEIAYLLLNQTAVYLTVSKSA